MTATPTAHGIDHARPITARGNHRVAQNDEPELEPCSKCKGSGKFGFALGGVRGTCWKCNGTGKVPA